MSAALVLRCVVRGFFWLNSSFVSDPTDGIRSVPSRTQLIRRTAVTGRSVHDWELCTSARSRTEETERRRAEELEVELE